ncbi:MAG: SGNH/GDSL hydrolase family protein [Lentisphaeria bacterium]|nr:SGNH/GDSL hydrolase family protein [Lentisphaeria bacterium]
MKKLLLLTLLPAALTLAGKDKIEADMERIADHASKKVREAWTWVFYGDSITHGASHTWGWRSFPEIFHERIRWECRLPHDTVINSGTSGNTTFELLNASDYKRRVKRYNPQVVFLLIGCNDIVKNKCNGVEGFRSRLEELVKRLQADKIIVVLQTYNTIYVQPNWGENHQYVRRAKAFPAFNQAIRDTAAKYQTILIDHEKYWKEHAASPEVLKQWLGEYIHPGARGHLEMANLILKTLHLYDEKSRCSQVKPCNPPDLPKM